MKKLKHGLLLACVPFLLLCSCSGHKTNAKRSSFSGGTLRINANEHYVTLFPPGVKDIVSSQIVSQTHLGLVKYDSRSLVVEPAIATNWDVDNLGTTYTFSINTKARFHDDDCFEGGVGRKITARDFKYTFTLLCTQSADNKNFFGTVDKIVGAKQYYKASAEKGTLPEIEGIKVLNDSTLQLVIENPYDLFIYCLANPSASVLAKEAVDKYGSKSLVGSGPFVINNLTESGETLTLNRFENYFEFDADNNQLPYLDTVLFSFVSSPRKEINMFFSGKLDLIMNLSNEYVNEILDEHIDDFESNPPKYILTRNEKFTNQGDYIMLRAHVSNFVTNKMETIDLSTVYVKGHSKENKDK